MQIKTEFIFPPIGIRTYDWQAWYDGKEEEGPYGWGKTEQEAISDLQKNYEVECDCWHVHQNLDLDRHTCGCPCHKAA